MTEPECGSPSRVVVRRRKATVDRPPADGSYGVNLITAEATVALAGAEDSDDNPPRSPSPRDIETECDLRVLRPTTEESAGRLTVHLTSATNSAREAATVLERDALPPWATFYSGLGDAAFASGRHAEAAEYYMRSLESSDLRSDSQQIAFDLIALAGCLGHLGELRAGATLVRILEAYCESIGSDRESMLPFCVVDQPMLTALIAAMDAHADDIARQTNAIAPLQRVTTARRIATQHLPAADQAADALPRPRVAPSSSASEDDRTG
jgi:hypothetical protein